jgi:Xaa-Pro aminopeptidase
MTGDSVTVLFGATEHESGELRTGFFQDPNFYYMTGWTEPGAILVVTRDKDYFLIPNRSLDNEKWTGPKLGPDSPNVKTLTGFETVLPAEAFESNLNKWVESGKRVYTLMKTPAGDGLKTLLPLRDFGDAATQIARLRMTKSAAEIAAIQHATDATIDAHMAAWKNMKPGKTEFSIAALMSGTYFGEGCERHAYAPIVGSGPNAAILHYSKNTRTIDNGELVLMDVAAECSMYASDITRTVPANGKFTPRQKELYEVVLGAQQAVINAIKPGLSLGRGANSLNKIAQDYIDSHGKDTKGNSLGRYFTHGVSHHVGLDVHDPSEPGAALAANMVITVEPGIYIPEEGIGIRIEDVVLVTENGAKVLSERLPRDPSQIEKVIASH